MNVRDHICSFDEAHRKSRGSEAIEGNLFVYQRFPRSLSSFQGPIFRIKRFVNFNVWKRSGLICLRGYIG